MIYLQLFYEFCKVGLFSIGGGLATIPFLQTMGAERGWFDAADLANMIAISESTPGPLGVNMASYVGFETAGLFGGLVATLGLITPSIIIVLIVAKMLQAFRNSRAVEAVFYGLRPASVALIVAAGISVAVTTFAPETTLHLPSVILAVVLFVVMNYTPVKKLHPICFIGLSAVVGIVFKF